MRNNSNIKAYLQIFLLLLVMMSIPKSASERSQGFAVAIMAPAWEQLAIIRRGIEHITDAKITDDEGNTTYVNEEIERLKLQNQMLASEIMRLRDVLNGESLLSNELQAINDEEINEALLPLLKLHQEDLINLLSLQMQSVPAQVIFRSTSTWKNSFWIDVGSRTNEKLGREVIAKNSPVVLGTSVVGVVDFVGSSQSRVRLITDSGLIPSVRVMRILDDQSIFLAKGELRGCAELEWRKPKNTLYGTGFNYDFPDDEGPARDLRTGQAVGATDHAPNVSIIQVDDLLITTGMDGVFPRGLQVGKVSHLSLLKEGDYCYEIEAVPTVTTLDDLTHITVLPALSSQMY